MGLTRIEVNLPTPGKKMISRWKAHFMTIIFLALILGTSFLAPSSKGFGADDFPTPDQLEYVNVDLCDIFRDLAEIGKFKILFAHEFHEKTTMIIKAGSLLKQTVSEIADNHGLKLKWVNSHTAVIGNDHSLAKIETGDVNLHVLPLKYIPSISVSKALETVVSSYKIRYDLKANEIAVMANSLELRNIKELINQWDRDLPLINMDIKVVEVTTDFLQAVGLSNSASSQIKVYPLTKQQMAMIAENTEGNLLAKQEVISFNKQQEELFFGDQIPNLSEENKAEFINYQIGYVDVGTNIDYSTRIDQEAEAELLVHLQAKVSTVRDKVTNQGANKATDQADDLVGKTAGTEGQSVINTGQREIKITVGLKPGETIMLTGALTRSEFLEMKTPLYEFSFLSSLFNNKPPKKAQDTVEDTATIVFMTPSFTEKIAYNAPQLERPKTETLKLKSVLEGNGQKGTGMVDTTNIQYIIKRHDTVTSISRKFGVGLQSIIKVNNLKNPGIIRANAVLMIPIPNERIYILKYKETIWRLAKRYDTTVEVLKDLNSITDVTVLRTGRKLVLPVPAEEIVNSRF